MVAMNIMFSCLWGVGWTIVNQRKKGILRRLKATPLRAYEYLLAQLVSRLMISMTVSFLVFLGLKLF